MPVVRHGTRGQITAASLSKSNLWNHVTVKRLTINMRVRTLQTAATGGAVGAQQAAQVGQQFDDFLLRVGNGVENTFPDKGEDFIKLPSNMCAPSDSVEDLITSVHFPTGTFSEGAAILVARNTEVDDINKKAIERFPAGEICI